MSEPDIAMISEKIELEMGLHFPGNRLTDLKKLIQSALPELGFGNSFEDFFHAIRSDSLNQAQFDILAMQLTIGETYFFREDSSLRALKNVILPPIIEERSRGNRNIRIWSAGCCTGEEVYTLAILLSELLPDIDSWNITLQGSDINRKFIQKAINGRYTQWSFRETPIEVRNRYFIKVGHEFEVIPRIKKMVKFSYINLADDKYPSRSTNTDAMDIILCRNVLMYFSVEQRLNVIDRFTRSLVPNGWFITSPVEVSNEDFSELTRVSIDDAILYRKGLWKDKKKVTESPVPKLQEPTVHVVNHHSTPLHHPDESLLQKAHPKIVTPKDVLSPSYEHPKGLLTLTVDEDAASFKKAEQCYNKGFYEEAFGLFEKLHRQTPNNTCTMCFLVKTSANLGRHAEARLWCEKLLASDTMNASYHYLLATILLELKESTQAEQVLQKVLYLDSRHVLAHFVLGNCFRNQGNVKMARKQYKNIMKLIDALHDDSIIPDSEGLTVGRMREMVTLFS